MCWALRDTIPYNQLFPAFYHSMELHFCDLAADSIIPCVGQVGCKKGERVWMLGFGTGFKCNSAVLRALRDVKTVHEAWT